MKNFWNRFSSWQEAEYQWDERAKRAEEIQPLKKLRVLPHMPGIALNENKYLKWKSFKYILLRKEGKKILKHILKAPFRYGFFYFKSLLRKASYVRDGDFFLYGLKSLQDFEKQLADKNSVLVLGFSYCQKPFECPDGRFSDLCRHDVNHLVCQQCPIGKTVHTLPEERAIVLIIPTVHYIGEKMFEIKESLAQSHPGKKIVYLITACELTLSMFGDFGNMLNIQGVGVRLDGRICNTMRAFILSEEGIKPGLTVVTDETQKRLLSMIHTLRNSG